MNKAWGLGCSKIFKVLKIPAPRLFSHSFVHSKHVRKILGLYLDAKPCYQAIAILEFFTINLCLFTRVVLQILTIFFKKKFLIEAAQWHFHTTLFNYFAIYFENIISIQVIQMWSVPTDRRGNTGCDLNPFGSYIKTICAWHSNISKWHLWAFTIQLSLSQYLCLTSSVWGNLKYMYFR